MLQSFSKILPIRLPRIGAVAALLALLAAPHAVLAQGDLLVAPTRIVLNGGGATEILLSNIGTTVATYRVSLELRRMTDKGELVPVDEATANPAQKAALAMIRYAPRRVVIEPGQPQSVRLSARPDAALPDGEYRVHMLFRAVPDAAPLEDPSKPAAVIAAKSVVIKLVPIYGITIPVIVRKGQLTATATIANPRLTTANGQPALELTLTRSGTRSVSGEIRVLPQSGGEPVLMARGIAVYPELEKRSATLGLSAEQAAKLKGGRWKIEYRELGENGGALIASLDTVIN